MQLKDNSWLKVKDFVKSDKNDGLVTFKLPKKDLSKWKEHPLLQITDNRNTM